MVFLEHDLGPIRKPPEVHSIDPGGVGCSARSFHGLWRVTMGQEEARMMISKEQPNADVAKGGAS